MPLAFAFDIYITTLRLYDHQKSFVDFLAFLYGISSLLQQAISLLIYFYSPLLPALQSQSIASKST